MVGFSHACTIGILRVRIGGFANSESCSYVYKRTHTLSIPSPLNHRLHHPTCLKIMQHTHTSGCSSSSKPCPSSSKQESGCKGSSGPSPCMCKQGGKCTCGANCTCSTPVPPTSCHCKEGGKCICGKNCTCSAPQQQQSTACKCKEGGSCVCGRGCKCK